MKWIAKFLQLFFQLSCYRYELLTAPEFSNVKFNENNVIHKAFGVEFQKSIHFFAEPSVASNLYITFNHSPRLSFALSASKIKEKARVVALDLRGHGKSSTNNDVDLSIEVCACQTKLEGYAFQLRCSFVLALGMHFVSIVLLF